MAPTRRSKQDLRTRDGFLVTTLFWTVLGLYGALPFALHAGVDLDATDAIFESISGLTTTGATVITGIDELPRSLLFYRQQLQWLGGIGIIVVAAVLPMLGIGGMQLYQAETPGPSKDSKLTPRITETAKALFYHLRWPDHALRPRLPHGRHEYLRCHLPRLQHRRDRRLFHPRCQYRLLR